MKLTLGLATALAGCAAAAQQAAQIYILPSDTDSTSTPSVSPSLARLILLQRLAPAGKGPSVSDIPDGADIDTVVELMNKYGGKSPSLFGQEQPVSPSQLVIMLEGLSDDQIKEVGEGFQKKPAFSVVDPPTATAHDKLVKNDFYNVGITNEHKCSITEVTNPFEERCWSGRSTVAKYNVKKQPEVLSDLARLAANLVVLAKSGEMETTLVLLPASGEAKQWSDKTQELRRRQSEAEKVMSIYQKPTESEAPTSPSNDGTVFYASTKSGSIPACFKSEDSCSTATGACSGHGTCVNKYAKADGSEGKEACYTCHCQSTVSKSGSLTHWAGPTCAKKDISVSFWLFAGFTLVMVLVLSMSIGMLFNVGEEKLPGVIGAGVSRTK